MRPFIGRVILFFSLILLSIMVSILVSFILEKDFGPEKDEYQKCSLVNSNEMKYHVSVMVDKLMVSSGALIVSTRYVLTVAQDVFHTLENDAYKERVKVHVGARTLPGGTAYDVEKITCHPSYDPSKITKDNIAVLRLAKESTSYYVEPVPLPAGRITAKPGLELIVSGYGAEFLLHTRYDLHKFPVRVVSGEKCRKFFGRRSNKPIDFSNKFCAFYARGQPSQLGDLGSPAVTTEIGWSEKSIVGITLRNGRYKGISAELFIDVSAYEKFIRDNM